MGRSRSRSRDKKSKKDKKERKRSRSRDKRRSRSNERGNKGRSDADKKPSGLRQAPPSQHQQQQQQQQSAPPAAPGTLRNAPSGPTTSLKDVQLPFTREDTNPKFQPKPKEEKQHAPSYQGVTSANPLMIEVVVNDRLGKKERIKCLPNDTIGTLKKLIAAKTGVRPEKIKLQKQHTVYKDHIQLEDYEIKHGSGLEMYYN